jgi:hypothetical protein
MARVRRRDLRQERKLARIDARTERRAGRQAAKTERAGYRAETKQTAYEHGMDPNAWVGDITDMAGDAFGMFANSKGGDAKKGTEKGGAKGLGDFLAGLTGSGDDEGTSSNTKTYLMIGGALLLGYLLMNKKRR